MSTQGTTPGKKGKDKKRGKVNRTAGADSPEAEQEEDKENMNGHSNSPVLFYYLPPGFSPGGRL